MTRERELRLLDLSRTRGARPPRWTTDDLDRVEDCLDPVALASGLFSPSAPSQPTRS